MAEWIRILIVEDRPTDAELAQREIKKVLSTCYFQRVETGEEYLRALAGFQPHLIISDYQMPQFDGLTAVKLALTHAPLTPVIILTGAINEDTAVECMKAGATDYVIKEHIKRLGQAVIHALEEKQIRKERHRAEQALQINEKRFRALIENSSDVVALLNAEGTIRYQSPSVQRVLGYRPDEMIGRNAFEFLHPDEHADAQADFQQMIEQPQLPTTSLVRYRCHDGSWRWLEVTATNQLDAPDIAAIVVNYRDITERKQAEEEQARLEAQLRQSQKMESIGRLAGGVAHDFNNLLTVMSGYTHIAKSRLREGDPLLNILTQIQRANERAAALTHQLLAFGRKQMLAPTTIDLNALTTNLYKMFERLIGEDIILQTTLDPALWTIVADAGQIEQVIINLVVNARDAMPTGGQLTIETSNLQLDASSLRAYPQLEISAGAYVVLVVSDTGHGMDEKVKARVFEPFFTTKEPGKGTGLGLATVYGIIKQSGGDVIVESQCGEGTIFKIYLPANISATQQLEEQLIQLKHCGGHETILLVEDEEMVRKLACTVLQESGYTVLESSESTKTLALAEAYQGSIDLLLTDVVMPQMSGPELAAQLRSRYPAMRILFMSGYTDDTVVRHGLLTAKVEFIPKPFSPSTLAAKVREVLDKHDEP